MPCVLLPTPTPFILYHFLLQFVAWHETGMERMAVSPCARRVLLLRFEKGVKAVEETGCAVSVADIDMAPFLRVALRCCISCGIGEMVNEKQLLLI